MLTAIRENATGWIAWTVIILVGLGLVATLGIQGYSAGGGATVAAKVNGEEVHMNDYLRAFNREQNYLQQQMGDNFDISYTERPEFKQRVLDQLVTREVITQYLSDAGFGASDNQVKSKIVEFAAFQDEDGKFSVENYKRVLRQQGYSETAFRDTVRADLVTQQLMTGVTETEFTTDFELKTAAKTQHQQRDVDYIKVSQAQFRDSIELTEEDLKADYESQGQRYMTQERVKVEYVVLDAADLVGDLEVDEEQVQALYDAKVEQELLTRAEERKARHILIKADDDLSESDAKAKAEGLLAELQGGADFAELAKEHSKDPGSAAQGGDLGFFGRGVMTEKFEETVFDELKQPGDLSGIVETPFGFHIIKLEEIAPESTKELAEVRGELEQEIRMENSGTIYSEKLQQLKDITYIQPKTFADVPAEMGIDVQSSDWFTRRGGDAELADQKVLQKVFDPEFIKIRENSDVIEVSDTKAVVVRVVEYEEPTKKDFAEVKSQIESSLKYRKAVEKAKETGEEIVAKLKDGTSLEEVAKEYELEVTDAGAIKRDATGHDRTVVNEVFKMPAPAEEGKSEFNGVATVGGDYYAISLNSVSDGSVAKLEEEVVEGLKQRVSQTMQNVASESFVDHLSKTADVVKFEDRL